MGDGPGRSTLILGGLGYFGARLADVLGAQGRVTVTSRRVSETRTRWLTQRSGAVSWQPFDSAASTDIQGHYETVINCATVSASEAARDPGRARALALKTVETCLRLLTSGRVRRVIQLSTFHVYGPPDRRTFTEDDPPRPGHPYGAAHLACEERLIGFSREAPIVVLRPTNIVGAPAHGDLGVQSNLLFLDCCRQAAHDRRIVLRSSGAGYRDFVPMDDAIAAVQLVMTAPVSGPTVFNVAQGEALTVRAAAEHIQREATRLLGASVDLVLGTADDASGEPFVVDRTRLLERGWNPKGSIDDQIRETLRFFAGDLKTPTSSPS